MLSLPTISFGLLESIGLWVLLREAEWNESTTWHAEVLFS